MAFFYTCEALYTVFRRGDDYAVIKKTKYFIWTYIYAPPAPVTETEIYYRDHLAVNYYNWFEKKNQSKA